MRIDITKRQAVGLVAIMTAVFYAVFSLGRAHQLSLVPEFSTAYDEMGYICSEANGFGTMEGHEVKEHEFVYAFGCVYSETIELEVSEMSITGFDELKTITIE